MAGDCSILDVGKIKTNLWTLSCNTKQVDDLCLWMADLFTSEERSLMSFVSNARLKSLCIYSKVIEENKSTLSRKLLTSLEATGNSETVEKLKSAQLLNDPTNEAQSPLNTARLKDIPNEPHTIQSDQPRVIQYFLNGKNASYSSPQALRIPQALQHMLTVISLSDLQVPLSTLKGLLSPCLALEELQLENILLHHCAVESIEESVLVLPRLKSYKFICHAECSKRYTWGTVGFFSVIENSVVDLVALWKSNIHVEIRTESMEIVSDGSRFLVSLPAEDFYDAPAFVPYMPKDYVRAVLRELKSVKCVTCLLPKRFDTIDFVNLPNDVKILHIAGLNITYDNTDCHYGKNYEQIQFENCSLPRVLLDKVTVAFPNAIRILFRNCRFDDNDAADITIKL